MTVASRTRRALQSCTNVDRSRKDLLNHETARDLDRLRASCRPTRRGGADDERTPARDADRTLLAVHAGRRDLSEPESSGGLARRNGARAAELVDGHGPASSS